MDAIAMTAAQKQSLVEHTRALALKELAAEEYECYSLVTNSSGFLVQIQFAASYPMIVLHLSRSSDAFHDRALCEINERNQRGITDCHYIDVERGCYIYRVSHCLTEPIDRICLFGWLNMAVTKASSVFERLIDPAG